MRTKGGKEGKLIGYLCSSAQQAEEHNSDYGPHCLETRFLTGRQTIENELGE